MKSAYPSALAQLVDELKRLPGIGPKSAQRLAIHLYRSPREQLERLSQLFITVQDSISTCTECFSLTDESPCVICADPSRDRTQLCVVEDPKDVLTLERSRAFNGLYHVLGGLIRPLDGVGPDHLRTRELIARLQNGGVREVILALNPTLEGDTTQSYVARLIQPLGVRTTRIPTGLPMGSDMDFADELTLTKALEGRRENAS